MSRQTSGAVKTKAFPWTLRVMLAALSAIAILGSTLAAPPAEARSVTYQLDIPSQRLTEALQAFALASRHKLLYRSELVEGKTSRTLKGEFTTEEALNALLGGTGLTYEITPSAVVLILDKRKTSDEMRPTGFGHAYELGRERAVQDRLPRLAAETSSPSGERGTSSKSPSGDSNASGTVPPDGIPEVLVKGSRTLNADIRRTRDDIQPYVVFDRKVIEKSGAANVEQFLKQRLTMNTVAGTNIQGSGGQLGTSVINLRGLGTRQTLILIDGRRAASVNRGGAAAQPDIYGIPLAAVERIEVLPTTASGIYGGSATGGVVNVILRRDYEGAELKVTYDNTFDTDSAIRRLDAGTGFTLEDGKTSVLLAGSYSSGNTLTAKDRDFMSRGRSRILSNNPGFFLSTTAAPPLGSTTNIRSVSGQNLVLKTGTALNSPFTYVPAGYRGQVSGDAGVVFAANAGAYNLDLPDSARQIGGGNGLLSNGAVVESLTATLRREMSKNVRVFVEGSGSRSFLHQPYNLVSTIFTLPASAPTNPFTQDIRVAVPPGASTDGDLVTKNENHRFAGGVIVDLPKSWVSEVDFTWTRTYWAYSYPDFSTAAFSTAVSSGAIDVLRDTNAYPIDYSAYRAWAGGTQTPLLTTLRDATLRLSGPIGGWPMGPITLSALIEHRNESLGDGSVSDFGSTFTYPGRSQAVDSVYVEAVVPLFSRTENVHELELQVATRWDRYKTTGATFFTTNPTDPVVRPTNETTSSHPTVGVRYQPSNQLVFRASYGTGFLPPGVDQLAPGSLSTGAAGVIVDPRRGNTTAGSYQFINGGNPNLQPEDSESWSAGVVLTPNFVSGLRLSVDWTKIDKADNISSLTNQQVVDNESFLPGRVSRGPNLPTDQPGWAGPIVAIDSTNANLSRAQVEAYDLQLDYTRQTKAFGEIEFYGLATWQTHYRTQVVPTSSTIENAGITSGNPLKLKANAGLTWRYREWTLGWVARFFDSYLVANPASASSMVLFLNQGSRTVPSQVYHDFWATYRFGHSDSGLLSDTEVQLGVNNPFNTQPPLDVTSPAAGYYSAFGDPRLASYHVSVKKVF